MLFLATHTHTWETCMAHDTERNAAVRMALSNPEGIGVNVHGMYTNAPAHRAYFILETDNADKIASFFDPLLEYGHVEVEPVSSASAYLE